MSEQQDPAIHQDEVPDEGSPTDQPEAEQSETSADESGAESEDVTEAEGAEESVEPEDSSAADDAAVPDDRESDAAEAEEEAEPEVTYQRYDCTIDERAAIEAAAEAARTAIERGECIVLPTDTVYGIGADAFSSEAVQALLDAKGRGRDMPPPVLIAEPKLIRALTVDVPAEAQALVDAFWPGPLTVICKAQPSLQMDLGETEGTVALRVPDHEIARTLLRRTGPMAVSSANLSGRPAAITCDQAIDQLGNSVGVYLDGGPLGENKVAPSTMVDFSVEDHGVILRHGALSIEQIREYCPDVEDLHTEAELVTPAQVAELHFTGDERLDVPETGAEMIALIEAAGRPEEPEEPGEPDGSEPDGTEPDGTEPDGTEPDEIETTEESDSASAESDDWPRQPPPGG